MSEGGNGKGTFASGPYELISLSPFGLSARLSKQARPSSSQRFEA
jgi:hypothetical protein